MTSIGVWKGARQTASIRFGEAAGILRDLLVDAVVLFRETGPQESGHHKNGLHVTLTDNTFVEHSPITGAGLDADGEHMNTNGRSHITLPTVGFVEFSAGRD